jgi:arylsulfatase A-like enzyme
LVASSRRSALTDASPPRRTLDVASILSLLLAVATALGGLFARSGLRDARLPISARFGLFGLEFVLGCLAIAIGVASKTLLDRAKRRLSRPLASRAVTVLGFALAWLLLFAYFCSWALFWSIGSFLDAATLTFVSMDSLILFKHFVEVSPKLLVTLPILAVGLLYASGPVTRALFERGSARLFRGLRIAYAVLLAASLAFTVWGETSAAVASSLVRDTEHGSFTTVSELYRHAEQFRSGPVSHFVLTLGSSKSAQPAPSKANAARLMHPAPVHIEAPPLVAMADYVRENAPAKNKRYNVIVLLVESMRPDVLRSMGGGFDVMPTLDALSQDSRRFTWTYAESSHSDYADLCPMSSHYPLRAVDHHYYPVHPPYPRVLIYDVLSALGYRTAIVSSQNEHWGGMYNYLDTGTLDHFFHAESFHGAVVDPEDTVFSKWAKDFGQSGKVDDRYTVDEAIRWIGESARPFFLYLNIQNSHFPYRTPEEFPKRFSPYVIDFPYTFGKYPIEKLGVVENRYRNSLSYMDAQLARLFESLRKSGKLDDTIIVVTGDNGEAFYEHGSAAHAGPLFDEAVRVAMFVHGPGVTPGLDDRLAQHIDIPPTVLGLLGMKPHPSFQGIDLLNAPRDPKRSAYLTVQTAITSQLALVQGGFKLIEDFNYQRYFLYDLVHDPGETRDLSDREPDRLQAMGGRLLAWQKAQLEYYSDPKNFGKIYPPDVSDADP